MSWLMLFAPSNFLYFFVAVVALLVVIGLPVGLLMLLVQVVSGERIKFFGLVPGEPVFDKYRKSHGW